MLPVIRNRSLLPGFADEFFGKDFLTNFFEPHIGIRMPAVNIKEGKDGFNIEVAAPGLDKDDFKIDLDNNLLTISCEKESKVEEDETTYMRREFNYTTFTRSFSLPETVDPDKIKASHHNGVLSIEIPRKEEAKKKPLKQIKIG